MAINVSLVRNSFNKARPIGEQVVNQFYIFLFSDFPDAKALFANIDMKKQKSALLQSLVTGVDFLDKPEVLTQYFSKLGERHVKYGVQPQHYEWVGSALLKTFAYFFGTDWNEELKSQWSQVYNVIAITMQKGAESAVIANKNKDDQQEHIVNLKDIQLPPLSENLKNKIKSSVKSEVLKLIKIEVNKYFKEEMLEIEKLTPAELIRKASSD